MDRNPLQLASQLPGKDAAQTVPLKIDSASLLGASRELIIMHNGREYRLRKTQNEKLILTA